jgi:hypothetical protein
MNGNAWNVCVRSWLFQWLKSSGTAGAGDKLNSVCSYGDRSLYVRSVRDKCNVL